VLGSATANTFSSGLNIVGGTVKIAGINSLGGTSGLTGAVSVGTGATLDLNGQATAAVGILTGFGTVINGGAGTSTFTVGSSTSNVLISMPLPVLAATLSTIRPVARASSL